MRVVEHVVSSVPGGAHLPTFIEASGVASKRPSSDEDSLQCTRPFSGVPLDFKNRESTCWGIAQHFYLSLQAKLRVLLAHAQLAKVFEEPPQHSANASECKTNIFGGASAEDVHNTLVKLSVDKSSQHETFMDRSKRDVELGCTIKAM